MMRPRWLVFVAVLFVPAAVARQPAETVPPPPPSPGTARPKAADAPSADAVYALGYRIGGQILADHEGMGIDLDRAALAKGLADAVTGAKPALDEAAFARAIATFEATAARRQADFARRMEEAGRTNLAKGREFMAANAKRPGVIVRPSGLQHQMITEGQGPAPDPDHLIVAHYRGTHIDGREFDATDPSGEPAMFQLRDVIPGWREALPLMKAGSKWRLWIPAELGYGAEGSPPVIEPNEVLVYEIDLVGSGPATATPRR